MAQSGGNFFAIIKVFGPSFQKAGIAPTTRLLTSFFHHTNKNNIDVGYATKKWVKNVFFSVAAKMVSCVVFYLLQKLGSCAILCVLVGAAAATCYIIVLAQFKNTHPRTSSTNKQHNSPPDGDSLFWFFITTHAQKGFDKWQKVTDICRVCVSLIGRFLHHTSLFCCFHETEVTSCAFSIKWVQRSQLSP